MSSIRTIFGARANGTRTSPRRNARAHRMRRLAAALGLAALGLAAASAGATPGGAFTIDWYTVDGGGGPAAGGDFALLGAIGQHDPGVSAESPFVIRGGFLPAAGAPAASCPADLDGNGQVDFTDLLSVLSTWGPCDGCPQDVNGDGEVGFTDLLAVLSAWGACP